MGGSELELPGLPRDARDHRSSDAGRTVGASGAGHEANLSSVGLNGFAGQGATVVVFGEEKAA